MKSRNLIVSACCVAAAAVVGSLAVAGTGKDHKDGAPEMKLPAGWTMEDMQACMEAGMLNDNHKLLARAIGTWEGKCTHWMAPGADPAYSDVSCVSSSFMDGRFIKSEFSGEMPGMGHFNGFGLAGYDNVSKKFVSMWVDNMMTGIMNGTGDLSGDSKTFTWSYMVNCPITKKPTGMREIQKYTGDNTMTYEMFCTDPKTGKEYKCMNIDLKRKS